MSKTRFLDAYNLMVEINKDLFEKFNDLHSKYSQNKGKYRKEYNEVGSKVLNVIRKAENDLCNTSERGRFSKFSTGLSEKFWQHIRKNFPLIDEVGIE